MEKLSLQYSMVGNKSQSIEDLKNLMKTMQNMVSKEGLNLNIKNLDKTIKQLSLVNSEAKQLEKTMKSISGMKLNLVSDATKKLDFAQQKKELNALVNDIKKAQKELDKLNAKKVEATKLNQAVGLYQGKKGQQLDSALIKGNISQADYLRLSGLVTGINAQTKDAGTQMRRLNVEIDNTIKKTRDRIKMEGEVANKLTDQQIRMEKQEQFYRRIQSMADSNKKRYGTLIDSAGLDKQVEQAKQISNMKFDSNKQMQHAMGKVNGEMSILANNAMASKRAMDLSNRSAISFGDALKNAAQKFGLWSAVTVAYYRSIQSFKNGIKTIRDLDTAMVDIQRVTKETAQAYDEFRLSTSAIGKEFAKTGVEVAKATTTFARMGYTLKESTDIAKEALLLSNVGNLGIEDASNAMISAVKGFDIPINKIGELNDAMNELGNTMPITVSGLAEALKRSASVMSMTGNTYQEVLALTSTANAVVQNPEKIGNALRTISLRMAGSTDKETGEDFSEIVPKLESDFDRLGIKLQDTEGRMKSTFQIFRELNQAFKNNNLSDLEKTNILELISGKYNVNVAAAILSNFDEAEKALGIALDSAGSAMKENEKYLDSIQGKTDVLKNTWQEFWIKLINSDSIKKMVDGLTGVVTILVKILDMPFGNVVLSFTAMATVMTLVDARTRYLISSGSRLIALLSQKTGVGLFGSISNQADMANNRVTVLSDRMKELKGTYATQNENLNTLKNQAAIRQSALYANLDTKRVSADNKPVNQVYRGTKVAPMTSTPKVSMVGADAKAISQSQKEITGLTTSMNALRASQMKATISAIAFNAAISIGIAVAVGLAITAIGKLINRNRDLVRSSQEVIDGYKTSMTSLEDSRSSLQGLSDEYNRLNAISNKTKEESEQFYEVTNKLADLFPDMVKGYKSNGEAIFEYSGNVKELNEDLQKQIDLEKQLLLSRGDEVLKGDRIKLKETNSNISDLEGQRFTAETNVRDISQALTNDNMGSTQRGVLERQLREWQERLKAVNSELTVHHRQKEVDLANTMSLIKANDDLSDTYKELSSEQKAIYEMLKQPIAENGFSSSIDMKMVLEDVQNSLMESDFTLDINADEEKLRENIDSVLSDIEAVLGITLDETKKEDIIQQAIRSIQSSADNNPITLSFSVLSEEELDKIEGQIEESISKIKSLQGLLDEMADEHFSGKLSESSVAMIAKDYEYLLPFINDEKKLREEVIRTMDVEKAMHEDLYMKKIEHSESYYNAVLNGNEQLISEFSRLYGVNLRDYGSFAQAKLQIEMKLLETINRAWVKHYNAVTNGLQMTAGFLKEQANIAANIYDPNSPAGKSMGAGYALSSNEAYLSVVAQVSAIREQKIAMESALNDVMNSNVDFGSIYRTDRGSSGGSKGSSGGGASGATHEIDQYANAIKALDLEVQRLQASREKLVVGSSDYQTNLNKEMELLEEKRRLTLEEIENNKKLLGSKDNKTRDEAFQKQISLETEVLNIQKQREELMRSMAESTLAGNDRIVSDIDRQNSQIETRQKLYDENSAKYMDLQTERMTNLLKKQAVLHQNAQNIRKILGENAQLIADGGEGFLTGDMIESLTDKLKDFGVQWWETEVTIRETKIAERLKEITKIMEDMAMKMSPFTSALDLLSVKFDLLTDIDFGGKIELLTNQFDLAGLKVAMLRDEYSKLSSIQPQTKEEAKELATQMASVASQVFEANKAMYNYARQMEMLRVDEMAYSYSNDMGKLEALLGSFKHNLKMLEGGLVDGTDISFGIGMLPDIPKSLLEEKRQELDKMIDEQRKYEEEIQKIREMSFDEQEKANEDFTESMRLHMIEHYDDLVKELAQSMGLQYDEMSDGQKAIFDTIKSALMDTENVYDDTWSSIVSKVVSALEIIKKASAEAMYAYQNFDAQGNFLGVTMGESGKSNHKPDAGKIITETGQTWIKDDKGQWIRKYAKGTDGHPGGVALVGEEGEELAILPNGKSVMLGRNGAELVDLPSGAMVIPNQETKDLTSYLGANYSGSSIPKYKDGTVPKYSGGILGKFVEKIAEALTGIPATKASKDWKEIYSESNNLTQQHIQQGIYDPSKVTNTYHHQNTGNPFGWDIKDQLNARGYSTKGSFAYVDKYGFSHVVDDYATALTYSKDGRIQEYAGSSYGGYAVDDKNNRINLMGLPGAVAFGNDKTDTFNYDKGTPFHFTQLKKLKDIENSVDEVKLTQTGLQSTMGAFAQGSAYGSYGANGQNYYNRPDKTGHEKEIDKIRYDFFLSKSVASEFQAYKAQRDTMMKAIETERDSIKDHFSKGGLRETIESQIQSLIEKIDGQTLKDVQMQFKMTEDVLKQQKKVAEDYMNKTNKAYLDGINSGTGVDALRKLRDEYADAQKEMEAIEEAIKNNIKARFDFEFAMMDKRMQKYRKQQDDIDFKMNVLNTATSSKDFSQQMIYNEDMVKSYKTEITALNNELKDFQSQQGKFGVGSYEWNILQDQIDKVNDSLKDVNLSMVQTIANNKKLANDRLSRAFENQNKELEKLLFDGETRKDAERALNKQKETHYKFLEGLEKEYALDMLIRDLRMEEITDFDEKIKLAQESEKLTRDEYETLRKSIEIKKMEIALEKLKGNKSIQQLAKDDEGNWNFEWVADEKAIKELEDRLTEAKIDMMNWNKELEFKTQDMSMQEKLDFMDRLNDIQQKALNEEYKSSNEFINDLKEIGLSMDEYSEWAEAVKNKLISDTGNFDGLFTSMSNSFTEYTNELNSLNARLEVLIIALGVDKKINLNDAFNNIQSFDTGGYTGSFNKGKLAVLHEKELVLNQDDTKNILDIVKMARGFDIKSVTANLGARASEIIKEVIYQTKVEAIFPNAENWHEINKALMSLPQSAVAKSNPVMGG